MKTVEVVYDGRPHTVYVTERGTVAHTYPSMRWALGLTIEHLQKVAASRAAYGDEAH